MLLTGQEGSYKYGKGENQNEPCGVGLELEVTANSAFRIYKYRNDYVYKYMYITICIWVHIYTTQLQPLKSSGSSNNTPLGTSIPSTQILVSKDPMSLSTQEIHGYLKVVDYRAEASCYATERKCSKMVLHQNDRGVSLKRPPLIKSGNN